MEIYTLGWLILFHFQIPSENANFIVAHRTENGIPSVEYGLCSSAHLVLYQMFTEFREGVSLCKGYFTRADRHLLFRAGRVMTGEN